MTECVEHNFHGRLYFNTNINQMIDICSVKTPPNCQWSKIHVYVSHMMYYSVYKKSWFQMKLLYFISSSSAIVHDDGIKWKHFPRYWQFVRWIHRSPVNSPHKGQWRWDLMFSLICAWINSWINNREAGVFRCHHAHYDVAIMDLNTLLIKCYATHWIKHTNWYFLLFRWSLAKWFNRPLLFVFPKGYRLLVLKYVYWIYPFEWHLPKYITMTS